LGIGSVTAELWLCARSATKGFGIKDKAKACRPFRNEVRKTNAQKRGMMHMEFDFYMKIQCWIFFPSEQLEKGKMSDQ